MSLIDHYGQGGQLEQRLLSRLADAHIDPDALTVHHLAGADEFHLGGRSATEAILAELSLTGTERVLDIGSGLGGPARHIAAATGCSVHGVDLADEFVDVACTLSRRVGLADRTSFERRDVGEDGLPDATVDLVTVFHVGMNIADKRSVFAAVADRLSVDGRFVVYDIMRIGDGELGWPMPWSSGPSTSFVETPRDYADAIEAAGLELVVERDLRPLVRDALAAADADPPPVNLGDLMGEDFPSMIGNLRTALGAGVLAPTLLIARR